MRRFVFCAVAVLLLAGCASEPEPEAVREPTPTPTVEVSANQEACASFGEVSVDLAEVIVNPPTDMTAVEATDGMLERIDSAYLLASGDVATRLQRLMDEIPEQGMFWLIVDDTDYLANVGSVARACEADGAEMRIVSWG
ncbi:hypothetical protein E3T43_00935 [Cryobacterium sp. Hh7]|uniref:hypothetical protein n=1 Tax=Cryobacterium sp. Hh7 TaxID=1259159 RepID=UPI00106A67E7|nr:hypothetical protein [Cryobacterium sp. Hh7]TFD61191.1 hypothetical protein E3T43_00935 [Cryobacterium sp. Hh7]